MPNHSKKLVGGTLTVLGFVFISSLFGYLLKFVLARTVSVSDIGLFYSVVGFVTFFMAFRDFGLADSLSYFIPTFVAKKKEKDLKSSISFTFKFQFLMSIIFFFLVLVSSSFLAKVYFKEEGARILLIILSVFFMIDGFNEVLFRAFHGFQFVFLNQSIEFFFTFFSSILMVLSLVFNLGLVFLGYSYVLSSLICLVVFMIFFFRKVYPDFFKVKAKITNKFTKKMFDYAFPAMIANFAIKIFSQQTIVLLTLLANLESVGYYVMALSLSKISVYLLKSIFHVFSPIITNLWAKKDIPNLNYYIRDAVDFSFVIGIPISVIFLFFSKETLNILFGESFLGASGILKLLAIYMLLISFTNIIRIFFLSSGNPNQAKKITYINTIVNLILNIVFIPSLGLIGAGIADLGSSFVVCVYAVYLKNKTLNITLPFKDIIKISFASAVFGILIFIMKKIIDTNIVLEMILILGVSGIIYLLLIFLMRILTLKKIDMILKAATNNMVKLPSFLMENKLFERFV